MPGVAFSRGERVALYTVERDDVEFLQRGRNHPEVRGPLGLADPTNATQVEETVEEWVERDDTANLLVCRDDDGTVELDDPDGASETDDDRNPTPMGLVSAWDLDDPRPTVAYWLLPDYHGEGYATEALALLLDHVFDAHDARGVEARVFSHNDASQALLDRLGFTREGELRENRFVEGAYRDEYVYGLLREEWVEDR
jgi:RimJ/RimL family protein N-acetyltransferase